MLSSGILGLPNAGKSTLFNALTGLSVPAESYPFCTVEPNISIVEVPDSNLEKLHKLFPNAKLTYETLKFVDVAGLVEDAHKGEGLGNQFLAELRGLDALVHTVRLFSNPNVAHPYVKLDPVRDVEVINRELMFADLEVAKRNLAHLKKKIRIGDKEVKEEAEVLEKIVACLQSNSVDAIHKLPLQLDLVKKYQFLTLKPMIYIANIDEKGLDLDSNPVYHRLTTYIASRGGVVFPIAAKLEYELGELSNDEEKEYREMIGLTNNALSGFVRAVYNLLGLITFYTYVGGKELRAWALSLCLLRC